MKNKYALLTKESALEPGVTFKTEIDEDGDLLVSANGVKVFYVDCENGQIRRFAVYSEGEQRRAGVMFEDNHMSVNTNN